VKFTRGPVAWFHRLASACGVRRILGASALPFQFVEAQGQVAQRAQDLNGAALGDLAANFLAEVARQPLWRNNIMAGRERQACRAARL